jgi:hypothetical protein
MFLYITGFKLQVINYSKEHRSRKGEHYFQVVGKKIVLYSSTSNSSEIYENYLHVFKLLDHDV